MCMPMLCHVCAVADNFRLLLPNCRYFLPCPANFIRKELHAACVRGEIANDASRKKANRSESMCRRCSMWLESGMNGRRRNSCGEYRCRHQQGSGDGSERTRLRRSSIASRSFMGITQLFRCTRYGPVRVLQPELSID